MKFLQWFRSSTSHESTSTRSPGSIVALNIGKIAEPANIPPSSAPPLRPHNNSKLSLPAEFDTGNSKIHLNDLFSKTSRERLLAICQSLPIEALNLEEPAKTDLMNRAVTVSLVTTAYVAEDKQRSDYADILVPRILGRLRQSEPSGIQGEMAKVLERLGTALSNGGRYHDALRVFRFVEQTLYGKSVAANRLGLYIYGNLHNIANQSGSREDIIAAIQFGELLPPDQRNQAQSMISKLRLKL